MNICFFIKKVYIYLHFPLNCLNIPNTINNKSIIIKPKVIGRELLV